VNFLGTRVKESNIKDALRLAHLLKYLKETENDKLFLKLVEEDSGLVMKAYRCASYGMHEDAKPQSGMKIIMGNGVI